MFLRELTASVDTLSGVGPQSAGALTRLGIGSVGALLSHYPRDWEDRSRRIGLAEFGRQGPAGQGSVCTEAVVLAHDWFGFGRMKTLKVHIEDETARAVLVCFNRPFLEKQLVVGERYRIWGRFYFKYGELQSTAFEAEHIAEGEGSRAPSDSGGPAARSPGPPSSFGAIVPVYPLGSGLSQGLLRRIMKRALREYGGHLEDELPPYLKEKHGLLPKAAALGAIHFPPSLGELEQAKRTLIYEELFYLETLVGRRAQERRSLPRRSAAGWPKAGAARPAAPSAAFPAGGLAPDLFSPLQRAILDRLPFELTPGQKSAVSRINADMESGYPMARLLQGDVGSGKTLVAFLAAARAAELGGQAAILAPTELLARQHAENAGRILEPVGIRPAFLTGNIKTAGRSLLLKALSAGELDLVVGTHALFSRDVSYKALRLAVVDEQHRFGVLQRSAVMAKGDHPDLLMMSATPIPRTLTLTVFGDLDVSVIPDLPPGRLPVKTHLAKQSSEQKVYDFVLRELREGRQAYFVYPLIEGGEDGSGGEGRGLKDAQSMADRLARKVFPDIPVALVHSRLGEEEKRRVMEAFRLGEVRVLVATSVVEVGVDVPNASCMVVEHAERFGLAALHQLRGRVGRGKIQSYCFLVYSDDPTEDGKKRLKVMLENSDGFVIAEEDLKLRGPGQIAGIEQSGYLALGIADPVRDAVQLAAAREDAFAMLEADPSLLAPEHRVVGRVLERAPPFSSVTL